MKTIHYLQHVPHEGPGSIQTWAEERGHALKHTALFEGEDLPDPREPDLLVILGGPMNIYEEEQHPWLKGEKRFIREWLALSKPVLGICLGSQLLADVLGGKVVRNRETEIGWWPVRSEEAAAGSPLFTGWPAEFTTLHWHGDRVELPAGSDCLFRSEGCPVQGFQHGERIAGLQFHPETTPDSLQAMVTHNRGEIVAGRFIQSEEELLGDHAPMKHGNRLLGMLLDRLLSS